MEEVTGLKLACMLMEGKSIIIPRPLPFRAVEVHMYAHSNPHPLVHVYEEHTLDPKYFQCVQRIFPSSTSNKNSLILVLSAETCALANRDYYSYIRMQQSRIHVP